MANFTEQATLKVIDKSSAQIRKINAELKKLFATARSLKSANINIKVNATGVDKAKNSVRQLNAELAKLKSASRNINLRTNASQLASVNRQIAAMNRNMAQLGRHHANLRVNTTNLGGALAMIQRLHAAANRPVNVNVNTHRTGGGGRGRGGVGGHGGTARVAGGLMTGIGGAFTLHQLGAAVGRAMKEGVSQADIGDTSLLMKQLDKVYGTGAEQAAKDAIIEQGRRQAAKPGGAFLNIGQRTQSFSEALGVTSMKKDAQGNWDTRAASFLTGEMESFTEILVSLGKSFDDAQEQAISYGKAMDQSGRLTDKAGNFDVEKATRSFDYLRQLMPTIGKEMTGDFVKNMVKYMSQTKYTSNDRALGAVLLMGEEMGTRAAVGYNQAVKQLSGQNVDKLQLANQIKAGLLQTKMETLPGKKKPQLVVTGVIDEEGLRTDAPKWVREHLLPLLEKEGQDAAIAAAKKSKTKLTDEEIAKAGKDYASDPTNVAKFTNKYVSERTAREAVAAMLYRGDEIQRQLDETAKRSGRKEDVAKAYEFSVLRAGYQMKNQMEGVAGELLRTMAPIMVPAMQAVSEKLRNKGEQLRTGKLSPVDFMSDIATDLGPIAAASAIAALGSSVGGPTGALIQAIGGLTAATLGATQAWNQVGGLLGGKDPYAVPTKAESEFKIMDQAVQDAQRDLATTRAARIAEATKAPDTAKGRAVRDKIVKDLDSKIYVLEQRLVLAAKKALAADDALKEEKQQAKETFEQTRSRHEAEGRTLIGPTAPAKPIKVLPPPDVPIGTKGDPFTVQPLPGAQPQTFTPESPEGQQQYWVLPKSALTPKSLATPLGPPDGKPVKVIPVTPANRPFVGDFTEPPKATPAPPVPKTPMQRIFGDAGGGEMKAIPASMIIDAATVPELFKTTFEGGATTIGNAGTKVGENAGSALDGQAGAIGGAIGRAAAAIISAATVKVEIPGMGGGGRPADNGPMPRSA